MLTVVLCVGSEDSKATCEGSDGSSDVVSEWPSTRSYMNQVGRWNCEPRGHLCHQRRVCFGLRVVASNLLRTTALLRGDAPGRSLHSFALREGGPDPVSSELLASPAP